MAASAKLKIGLKKIKCSPPTKGIHVGQLVLNDREIEHIDNFTIEPSRITAAIRYMNWLFVNVYFR